MDQELEALAVDAMTQFLPPRPPHGRPPGSPCANCGTVLDGPWCHACGQSSADFHRSAWHMLLEFFEGLFHFDSRLWRTLPDLVLRPARLSRHYVDGHRVAQVPPLRLFLVTLLLLFLVGALTVHSGRADKLDPATAAELAKDPEARAALAQGSGHGLSREALDHIQVEIGGHHVTSVENWLKTRIQRAADQPKEYARILEGWGERFAFLMLPLTAFLLSLIFVFQRRFWLYDHLVFAMHSLSFQGLLLSAVLLSAAVLPESLGDVGATAYAIAAPWHLFAHLRGFYGGGWILTLWRMFLLGMGSLIGILILLIGLLSVGLVEMGA